jgi:hypothetical protein
MVLGSDTGEEARMTSDGSRDTSPLAYARLAGALYLVIIVFGIFGEMFVRSSLIVPGDITATADNIMASEGLFRVGFLSDSIMFLSDVALAVLLYVLLRPVSKVLSLMAMCFRLAQTAVIATNLLNYHAAVLVLQGPGYSSALGSTEGAALTSFFLDLHAHGYDLGLLLFGVHCVLLGYLVFKSGYLPKVLGILTVAAGLTYLIGSYTRFLAPSHMEAVSPTYIVAIVAEVALCLWLLIRGVDAERWKRMALAMAPAD